MNKSRSVSRTFSKVGIVGSKKDINLKTNVLEFITFNNDVCNDDVWGDEVSDKCDMCELNGTSMVSILVEGKWNFKYYCSKHLFDECLKDRLLYLSKLSQSHGIMEEIIFELKKHLFNVLTNGRLFHKYFIPNIGIKKFNCKSMYEVSYKCPFCVRYKKNLWSYKSNQRHFVNITYDELDNQPHSFVCKKSCKRSNDYGYSHIKIRTIFK